MFTYPIGLLAPKNKTVDNNFKFTINTALGTGASLQLPLPSGQTYDFIVDWGDGGSTDHITAYNQVETLHTYSSGGIYQVSINGKCGGWSFNNGGDRLKITSVDHWGDVQLDYLFAGFYGCANLTTYENSPIRGTSNITSCASIFRNCTSLNADLDLIFTELVNVTTFRFAFYNNTSQTTNPTSNLFKYNVNCTSFSGTFYNNKFSTLPSDFFRYNTLVTSFQETFYLCLNLVNLSEDLFYYNSLVVAYNRTFVSCRNIILPTRLFNLSNLSIVTTFEQFMSVASISYSFTGTIQDIWNYATSANSTNAFLNQTALSNYASIPNSWKGL